MKIGIIGSTGVVGRKFIDILEKKNIPVEELVLYASEKSKGKIVLFRGKDIVVKNLEEGISPDLNLMFIAASSEVSKRWVPEILKNGTTIIDNSSGWRMDENVPLVVPEVNGNIIKPEDKLIANPNCVVSQLVVALKPLVDVVGISELCITSLQSVSGAGIKGIEDLTIGCGNYLKYNAHDSKEGFFPYPIAFNLIPQIGSIDVNGNSAEEVKVVEETRKILNLPELKIAVTCVRVPVYYGHSISVTVKLKENCKTSQLFEAISNAKGTGKIIDSFDYVTPRSLPDDGLVYIGRLRKVSDLTNTFSFWVVADNLLKGAALNAVQIAELLLQMRGVD